MGMTPSPHEFATKTIFTVFVIITSVASTTLAKGPMECDLTDLMRNQQCFGAEGQPLVFNLPHLNDHEIKLTKDEKQLIFKIATNGASKIYISGIITDQKFTLDRPTKTDSGNYQLEVFNKNGILLKKVDVHVEVGATVSKPVMSQTCLSAEEQEVSCSAEGDDLQFALTLDQDLLTKSPAQDCAVRLQNLAQTPEEEGHKSCIWKVNVSLHAQLTGSLSCSVWNNFSSQETIIQLKGCGEFPSYLWYVAVTAAILLTLLLITICLGRKYRNEEAREESPAANNVEYSDAAVVRPSGTSGSDVIYSAVVVGRPSRTDPCN